MPSIWRFLFLWLAMTPGLVLAEALPAVVVTGDPVAPSPAQPGTGLCTTTRISTSPASDFPQTDSGFNGGVNAFLDATPNASNPNARVTTVLRTLSDLSNNNIGGSRLSDGDFVNAVPGCPAGGCDFAYTDTSVSFGLRLRGYLNVTPGMVGTPVHFGFYADDALSFTLYDRQANAYRIINRPPKLGVATWRTTNSVTFTKSGLYAAEVLYAEIAEHAALEMSMWVGDFTDFERPANQAPVLKLDNAGFALLTPASFFQTESGGPSRPDLDQCQQCDRQYANTAGNNGCDPATYCNGAALCAPCDSSVFCGPSCSPCGASTPLCINRGGTFTCVQCTDDSQCPTGRCDPATHQCRGCRTDAHCPSGQVCDPTQRECVACAPDSSCGDGGTGPGDGGGGSTDGGGGAGDAGSGSADGGTGPGDGGGGPTDGGGEAGDGGSGSGDGGGEAGDGGGSGSDGGTSDGATPGSDGGPTKGAPGNDVPADGGDGEGPDPVGCGCGAGASSLVPLCAGGLALLMRRRGRSR